jgi:nitroreductase
MLPVRQTIPRRFSVRMYQRIPIAADVQQELQARLKTLRSGALGLPVRLELIAAGPGDSEALRGLGTYGAVQDPAGFIAGAVQDGETAMEDFGYAMEQAVLPATELGLGSCWLGGLFSQSSFARRVGRREDEVIPAIVAAGYALEDVRVRDRSRLKVQADQRLPWQDLFFDGRFGNPLTPQAAGSYWDALEMLRLGPSAKNKQPWRVVRLGRRWHFYCQRTAGYGKGTLAFALIGAADLQRIDLGIAMCHFELTAREGGLRGSWTRIDPGLRITEKNTLYVATWEEK